MVALIEAAEAATFPAEIKLVISNRPKAPGLQKAELLGVKSICIDHRDFETRSEFEAELDAALRSHKIEFIACAGFMRVLGENFVKAWSGKLINIHPSLLPKYKGLNTHKRALDAGDAEHGCTVHWVNEGVDEGEIIAQSHLEIIRPTTADELAKQVQQLEHRLYPNALKLAVENMAQT